MIVHIILASEKLRQEDNGFIASRITLRPFLKSKQKQLAVVAHIFSPSMEESVKRVLWGLRPAWSSSTFWASWDCPVRP